MSPTLHRLFIGTRINYDLFSFCGVKTDFQQLFRLVCVASTFFSVRENVSSHKKCTHKVYTEWSGCLLMLLCCVQSRSAKVMKRKIWKHKSKLEYFQAKVQVYTFNFIA